jgi:CRISPR-associated protein Cas2
MYIIAVYDVDAKRCSKMMKLCRRYLHHIQNSVFEGEITESNMQELRIKSKEIMQENDSFILFRSRSQTWLEKEILGTEKRSTDSFF